MWWCLCVHVCVCVCMCAHALYVQLLLVHAVTWFYGCVVLKDEQPQQLTAEPLECRDVDRGGDFWHFEAIRKGSRRKCQRNYVMENLCIYRLHVHLLKWQLILILSADTVCADNQTTKSTFVLFMIGREFNAEQHTMTPLTLVIWRFPYPDKMQMRFITPHIYASPLAGSHICSTCTCKSSWAPLNPEVGVIHRPQTRALTVGGPLEYFVFWSHYRQCSLYSALLSWTFSI